MACKGSGVRIPVPPQIWRLISLDFPTYWRVTFAFRDRWFFGKSTRPICQSGDLLRVRAGNNGLRIQQFCQSLFPRPRTLEREGTRTCKWSIVWPHRELRRKRTTGTLTTKAGVARGHWRKVFHLNPGHAFRALATNNEMEQEELWQGKEKPRRL